MGQVKMRHGKGIPKRKYRVIVHDSCPTVQGCGRKSSHGYLLFLDLARAKTFFRGLYIECIGKPKLPVFTIT